MAPVLLHPLATGTVVSKTLVVEPSSAATITAAAESTGPPPSSAGRNSSSRGQISGGSSPGSASAYDGSIGEADRYYYDQEQEQEQALWDEQMSQMQALMGDDDKSTGDDTEGALPATHDPVDHEKHARAAALLRGKFGHKKAADEVNPHHPLHSHSHSSHVARHGAAESVVPSHFITSEGTEVEVQPVHSGHVHIEAGEAVDHLTDKRGRHMEVHRHLLVDRGIDDHHHWEVGLKSLSSSNVRRDIDHDKATHSLWSNPPEAAADMHHLHASSPSSSSLSLHKTYDLSATGARVGGEIASGASPSESKRWDPEKKEKKETVEGELDFDVILPLWYDSVLIVSLQNSPHYYFSIRFCICLCMCVCLFHCRFPRP